MYNVLKSRYYMYYIYYMYNKIYAYHETQNVNFRKKVLKKFTILLKILNTNFIDYYYY